MPLTRESGIYQIVNTITQKRYIGLASNIGTRINGHKSDLALNKHDNDYLQKAYNKYGKHAFKFEVIELCSKDKLHMREDYWVKSLNVTDRYYGYNIKPTEPNRLAGHSLETIAKFKTISKDRKFPEAARVARNAIPMSQKHKNLLAYKRQEALDKLGITHKERQRNKRGYKVINTITNQVYRSVADLSDEINIPVYELSRRLSGRRKNNTVYKYL